MTEAGFCPCRHTLPASHEGVGGRGLTELRRKLKPIIASRNVHAQRERRGKEKRLVTSERAADFVLVTQLMFMSVLSRCRHFLFLFCCCCVCFFRERERGGGGG